MDVRQSDEPVCAAHVFNQIYQAFCSDHVRGRINATQRAAANTLQLLQLIGVRLEDFDHQHHKVIGYSSVFKMSRIVFRIVHAVDVGIPVRVESSQLGVIPMLTSQATTLKSHTVVRPRSRSP